MKRRVWQTAILTQQVFSFKIFHAILPPMLIENTSSTSNRFGKRILGRTGLEVGPIGLGSSYGAPAQAYEEAFEKGLNYFYWGSTRKSGMKNAIKKLSPHHRDKMKIALQSYSRWPTITEWTFKHGLYRLGLDYADILLLGWYDHPPSNAMLDKVQDLKRRGLVKFLAISCHDRPRFQHYMKDPRIDLLMIRYNAAHPGAETEVFPFLDSDVSKRPGVMTYTTTRWGHLVNPKHTPPGVKTPSAVDCYRFALSHPAVDLCMSGPSTLEEMRENLKALELGPMNEQEIKWMKQVGAHVRKSVKFTLFPDPKTSK